MIPHNKTMSNHDIERTLRRWSDAYYNGNPEVDDDEFDFVWNAHRENRQTMPDDPVWKDTILDRVGAPVAESGFKKVAHATPMLSLDNVFEDEDGNCEGLVLWLSNIRQLYGPDVRIVAEPKIDGLSLELVYEDGKLIQAITRGDGCLDGNSLLEFESGEFIPIQEVVEKRINGRVRCVDLDSGEPTWGDLIDFFQNGEVAEWLDIELEDKTTLRVTPNHLVYVTGIGFVEASRLSEGDQVLTTPSPRVSVRHGERQENKI